MDTEKTLQLQKIDTQNDFPLQNKSLPTYKRYCGIDWL